VASIFPWLSQVAQRYETYKFSSVKFEYHTRAATSQTGTVGLVFDFDAQDDPPMDQMSALSYHDKSADAPWKDMSFSLDLRQGDHLPARYTRSGLPASPYDLKTLDLGNLHVFTDGVTASANLGLLEVCYDIELFTPQIQPGVGGRFFNSAGLNATHLIGTVASFSADKSAIAPFIVTDTATLTFNQTYQGLIAWQIAGTGLGEDMDPHATGEIEAYLGQLKNAASTGTIGVFRINAQPGTVIVPTITATTVTAVNYWFGEAYFPSLVAP